MYMEEEFWNWIDYRVTRANMNLSDSLLKDILKECGDWKNLTEIKAEHDCSTEHCFKAYWFVIHNDKMFFTEPDEFAEELDEYLGL